MRRAVLPGTARQGKQKTPLSHTHGTKACCFCDTTQIGAPLGNARSLHVPSYVSRWITGGIPSAPTGNLFSTFKAALRSPFTDGVTLPFHHRELSVDLLFVSYSSSSQVFLILRYWYYMHLNGDLSIFFYTFRPRTATKFRKQHNPGKMRWRIEKSIRVW